MLFPAYAIGMVAEIEAERKQHERMKPMILQPGTELRWQKCAVGQEWNGSVCLGDRESMTWSKALLACPSGYRLPTRAEFVALLGGCDADVEAGNKVRCVSVGVAYLPKDAGRNQPVDQAVRAEFLGRTVDHRAAVG